MSREIKFRAWDGEAMLEDVITTSAETIIMTDDYEWHEVYGVVVEQYTGLKDKNGKEIYEGDIVGIYNYYYNEETGEDEPGELEPWGTIVYEAPTFGLWGEPIYGGEDKHFFEVSNNMVVIGNVHENKELLDD